MYGGSFNADIDDLSRKNLGCTLIATFGTETTKSAIQTACRGYRSEDFPDGNALYMPFLIGARKNVALYIPLERTLWNKVG